MALEVAGVALGAFPMCILLMGVCRSGIKVYKDMQEHGRTLREFQRELSMEQCKFRNSLYHIFGDTISPDPTDNPLDIFRDMSKAKERLKEFIEDKGSSIEPPLRDAMEAMVDKLCRLQGKFQQLRNDIDNPGTEQSTGNTETGSRPPNATQRRRRKSAPVAFKNIVKLVLCKEELNTSMLQITKINTDLHQLLNRDKVQATTRSLSNSEAVPPWPAPGIRNHCKTVQESARSVFDSLRERIQAPHECEHTEHAVGFCLEERIGIAEPQEKLSFSILIRLSGGPPQSTHEIMWRGLAIDVEDADGDHDNENQKLGQQAINGFGGVIAQPSFGLSNNISPKNRGSISEFVRLSEAHEPPVPGLQSQSTLGVESVSSSRRATNETIDTTPQGANRNHRMTTQYPLMQGPVRDPDSSKPWKGRVKKFIGGVAKKIDDVTRAKGPARVLPHAPQYSTGAVARLAYGIGTFYARPVYEVSRTAGDPTAQQTASYNSDPRASTNHVHDAGSVLRTISNGSRQIPRSISELSNLGLDICGKTVMDCGPTLRSLGHLRCLRRSSKRYKVSLVPVGKCLKISNSPDQESSSASSARFPKFVSLQALLASNPTQGPKKLSRIDKLSIAIKLASSVIQLCNTWCLRESWSKRNIIFFYDPKKKNKLLATRPVIMHTLRHRAKQPETGSVNDDDDGDDGDPRIRHNKRDPLFLLGLILWELWYEKAVEDSNWIDISEQLAQGTEVRQDYLLWKETSLSLVAIQADETMRNDVDVLPDYQNAVQACFSRSINPTNENFIDKAWKKIVLPLKNLHNSLGRLDHRSSVDNSHS